MSIFVLASGLLTTIQDAGRVGHAAIGIGAAGAMDSVSLRLANILVGNVEKAASLEITLRGPRLRFDEGGLIAITGAAIDVRCDGAIVPLWSPIAVRAGCELTFGGMPDGARSYLAVRGGIERSPVLGSRSVDVNAGLGSVVAQGETLRVAASTPICRSLRTVDRAFAATKWSLDPNAWFDTDQPLGAIQGSHFGRLDEASRRALFDTAFHIGNDSNRVGYRLEGPNLALSEPLELISEAVVPGSVQLPPSGAPIVLMAEAPTTGGYPRIAQVASVDLPVLAQKRPGDTVRFTRISLADAQTRYLEREQAIASLARTVGERLRD